LACFSTLTMEAIRSSKKVTGIIQNYPIIQTFKINMKDTYATPMVDVWIVNITDTLMPDISSISVFRCQETKISKIRRPVSTYRFATTKFTTRWVRNTERRIKQEPKNTFWREFYSTQVLLQYAFVMRYLAQHNADYNSI
jgi:hypothetical protein